MIKDFAGMMKQMQAMQDNMQKAQAEIADLEVEGRSGGGLVSLTLSGQGHMRRLTIDPSLINADDREVLEDLIIAAFNDAKVKADHAAQEKLQAATGGIAGMLPPGMKLPF
jgi:nucleoid-associated protein EbfC